MDLKGVDLDLIMKLVEDGQVGELVDHGFGGSATESSLSLNSHSILRKRRLPFCVVVRMIREEVLNMLKEECRLFQKVWLGWTESQMDQFVRIGRS